MKKIALIISVFFFIAFGVLAQNAKIQEQKFTYTRLPLEPLPMNIKTYKIEKILPEKSSDIASLVNFKLDGYLEVNSNPDLEITLKVEPFEITKPALESKYVEEKKGSATVKVKYVAYFMQCSFPVSYHLYDKVNKLNIGTGYVNNSKNPLKITTEFFRSLEELNDHTKETIQNLLQETRTALIKEHISALNSLLSAKYAYAKLEIRQQVVSLESKKKEYADLDSAQTLAVKAYATIKEDKEKGFEEFKGKIQAALRIWNRSLQESDVQDKTTRINAEASFIILQNCAFAQYWMNNFERARVYLSMAERVHKNVDWIKELRQNIQEREKRQFAYQNLKDKTTQASNQ